MSTGKPIPHRREKPCPVCGGWATLPHGRGIRCVGMTGDFLVWCTREERAGNAPLDLSTSPPAYRHHRTGWCPCGTEHDHAMPSPGFAPLSRLVAVATPPATELRTAAADHATVFEGALDLLTLRADARADLTRRGLAAGAIERMRFRSAPETLAARHRFLAAMVERFGEATIRATPGFTDRNHELVFWSGAKYIVPFRDEQGRITGWQAKILGGKYRTARLSSFAHIYHVAGPLTPGADLHVTEGGLKACVAAEIGGVATFGVAGQSLTPNHLAVIQRLAPGRVIVALDQEANAQTVRARQRWAKLLAEAGLPTFIAVWEGADLGGPKGLDDLFVNGSKPRLRQFVFTPPAISTRRIPRPTTTRGDVAAGMSLAAARERVVRAVGQFLRGPHQTDCAQEALLVRAGAGTGKSTAVGLQLDPTSPTRIAVGTTNLAAELALAHGYGLVVGRNEQNCIRADVVGALAANGFDVARLACGSVYEPHCPERRHCPYWLQFERPGPLIGAAEQLYNPTFLRDASVVIADDADLPRAIVERHTVSREAIARAIDRLDDGGPAGAARRLLTLGAHALVGAPLWPALQGPAVWDHLARTAAREGMILAALIEAVPSRWGFPDPERNARGMVSVDTVEAAPPAIVGRLVEALQEELPAFLTGEDFNCRLRLSSSGFSIAALRQPAC
ncbi:MAG: primase, partial [Chloroflexota bacterium]|nr:primase [Chloroflexota bacterium]